MKNAYISELTNMVIMAMRAHNNVTSFTTGIQRFASELRDRPRLYKLPKSRHFDIWFRRLSSTACIDDYQRLRKKFHIDERMLVVNVVGFDNAKKWRRDL